MPNFDDPIIAEGGAGDDLDLRRSSACATFMHLLCDSATGVSLSTGAAYGALAYNKAAGTYTKIRFCTGATSPSALTSVVLGVTDISGTVLASTADIHASVTTSNQLVDNIALSASVTLTLNEPVYLAIAWAGTTLNVLGFSLRNAGLTALAQFANPLVRSKGSGYTTGALPALTSSGVSAAMPWIELIP